MTSFPSKSACVFCSPCNTRNFGATPRARKSFNASETNCIGFCFVVCVPVSLITLSSSRPNLCTSQRSLCLCVIVFFPSAPSLHPIGIEQNFSGQSALQFRKRTFKSFKRRSLSKQRLQIQPPRFEQRRHLHPSPIHPPPI